MEKTKKEWKALAMQHSKTMTADECRELYNGGISRMAPKETRSNFEKIMCFVYNSDNFSDLSYLTGKEVSDLDSAISKIAVLVTSAEYRKNNKLGKPGF